MGGARVLTVTAEVRYLQRRFTALEHRFTAIELRLTGIEGRLGALEGRFSAQEDRMTSMLALIVRIAEHVETPKARDGADWLCAEPGQSFQGFGR